MRQLASIQKVISLKPIVGADRIELAQILGWEVIVKKGEYKLGDNCVYVEIDSLLPEKPEFEFMRARKFKVKTLKMKGVVSQGIAFPTSILPRDIKYCEGADVTEELGVKNFTDEVEIKDPSTSTAKLPKWVSFLYGYRLTRPIAKVAARLMKPKTYEWPSFIPKTDEERIQNRPWFVDEIAADFFYATEKLDGSSMTCFCVKKGYKKEFGVCSRNRRLPKDNSKWWQCAVAMDLENKMKNQKIDFYIQGELCGPNIQGNKYKLKELTFFLFNVYDLTNQRFIDIDEARFFLDIPTVPNVTGEFIYFDADNSLGPCIPTTVKDLIEKSKGVSQLNPETPREGIVIRLLDSQKKQSVKVINPDFLLKYDL